MEIPNREYFLETEVFNFSGGGSKSVYHGGTYIGHLKLKNGGMKIVGGTEDDAINEERKRVLDNLDDTLHNKTNIDPNNVPNYYKALEGTYIRSLICPDDNDEDCQKKVDYAVKHGYKLSKLLAKKLKINSKEFLKENAPKLYQQIKESKYWPKIKELVKKYGTKAIEYGIKTTSEMNKNGGVGSRELSESGSRVLNKRGGDYTYEGLDELINNYKYYIHNQKDIFLLGDALSSLEKLYIEADTNNKDIYITLFNRLYNVAYNFWKLSRNPICEPSQRWSPNPNEQCNNFKEYVQAYAPMLYYLKNSNGGSSSERGGDGTIFNDYSNISPGLVRGQVRNRVPLNNSMTINQIKDLILSNQTSRVSELKNAFESIEHMYINNKIDAYLKLFNSLYNYGRRNWTRNPGTTCTRLNPSNTRSECDDYNEFVNEYAPILYVERKKLMGYKGGYSVYNPNTGVYENKGELGVATLNKLKRERDEESRGLSSEEFEKRKALMAYRGGDSLLNQLRIELGR